MVAHQTVNQETKIQDTKKSLTTIIGGDTIFDLSGFQEGRINQMSAIWVDFQWDTGSLNLVLHDTLNGGTVIGDGGCF